MFTQYSLDCIVLIDYKININIFGFIKTIHLLAPLTKIKSNIGTSSPELR